MTPVRITVIRVSGSTPREAGAAMLVWPDAIRGTIGGGALEWQAMAEARAMLAEGRETQEWTVPLGPALGQCCGGAVTLGFDRAETLDSPAGRPLWIWGAGHVGRALVDVIAPLPDRSITWIDSASDRFPDQVPGGVDRLVAADPPRLVPHAPAAADHLILTHSHDIDLALCHALLSHGFASAGLIGSQTKWARFRSRLSALGHAQAQIARITCPIGDPGLGKHPQAIAIGVAAQMLRQPAAPADGGS